MPVRNTHSVDISPLASLLRKSIWGETWRIFNGIQQTSTGIQPIEDTPSDYARAYTAESYVYRCADVRGKAIASIPLRVYELDSEGKRVKSLDHEALALMESTNPIGYVDSIPTLMRYTLTSLDFHGRCAWRLAFNATHKVPTEIYWVIPSTFRPKRDPAGYFGGIEQVVGNRNGDGGTVLETVPPEELVYLTTPNLANPLLGTSKIQVLRQAINLRMMAVESNKAFFENSQRPDVIVTGDWDNSEETIEDLRRAWRSAFQGDRNRSPLFLGQGASAHLLTLSPKDAEWIQQQRISGEEIASVFGVPVIYLNNFERATYDNVSAARRILYNDTMIPEGDQLAGDLTRRFLTRFWGPPRAASGKPSARKRLVFGFDYLAIEGIGEDVQRIWERVSALWQRVNEQVKNHELTPNQARMVYAELAAQLGLDPGPWRGEVPLGDTFIAQHTYVPVDQLSLQALIDVNVARSGKNPELIENVPGAEHAGENAARIPESGPPSTPPPQSPPPSEPAEEPGAQPTPPEEEMPAKARQVNRQLKRIFQDLQREALRSLRPGRNARAGDPYRRDHAVALLAEQLGLDLARQVEEALHEDVVAAGADQEAVAQAFRVSIDELARVLAVEVAGAAPRLEPHLVLGPGVRVY